jgi:hypothetical protein
VDLDLLYGADGWIIQVVFLLLIMAGVELGFQLGRKSTSGTSDRVKAQISVVEGSLVGLLGLLLGFTMSMAVSRFEIRKQLVLDEANAIGTSYLRTQLLPAPEGTEIANLLREYVDIHIHAVAATHDLEGLDAVRGRLLRLQEQFWARAVAYSQKNPSPVTAGLLLQSLNQAIDLGAARWMAFHNHVPEPVIYVNAFVALLTVTLVGYAFGIDGVRHIFSMCLLGLAIAVVLGVIIDLDRPRRGFIQVSQQPMIDLQHQLWAHRHAAEESTPTDPTVPARK